METLKQYTKEFKGYAGLSIKRAKKLYEQENIDFNTEFAEPFYQQLEETVYEDNPPVLDSELIISYEDFSGLIAQINEHFDEIIRLPEDYAENKDAN